jgi:hypothetical protein
MTTRTARPHAGASKRSKAADGPRPRVLGVALDWIERHCVVPDGFRQGRPFRPYDWQVRYLGNFYLVKGDARWDPVNPVLGPAFVYRRAMMVGPQKLGKDPMMAAQICLEAVGPALFGGWAGPDEGYVCAERGCGCGWEYPYEPGEPRGMPWPTALIQVFAYSQTATDNTYDALRPMIDLGPLTDLIPKTGEEFIRLPNGGRIDTVTSEARSRLGNRVTHASGGELGIMDGPSGMIGVFDTIHRGLAGMGGRGSGTTNAWDPARKTVAQRAFALAEKDVYIQFDRPPSGLSIEKKDERKRILRSVYPPDVRRENGGHVDLDSIEAEAAGLAAHDAPQAGRFFGNQLLTGGGTAFDVEAWARISRPDRVVADGAQIALGFDGSKTGDWTALVAADLATGLVWPIGIWAPSVQLAENAPPEVDRDAVDAAVDAAFRRFRVVRMYADPPYWKEEINAWQGRHGDKVVLRWETYRNRPMGQAVRSFAQAIADRTLSHPGDQTLTEHIGNATRLALNERDDKGQALWKIQKETPDSPRKIDAAMAAILAWEARNDAIATGALAPAFRSAYEDERLTFSTRA